MSHMWMRLNQVDLRTKWTNIYRQMEMNETWEKKDYRENRSLKVEGRVYSNQNVLSVYEIVKEIQ